MAQTYRCIPPYQLKEVQEHITGLQSQKVIVESHSPYAAPVVVVRKKDRGIRLCVDYRRLSEKTVGDAYPLPRTQEPFDALVGAQFFTLWTWPAATIRSPCILMINTRLPL